MASQPLTDAELIYLQRMLPHVAAGKSIEAAARAVLDDDQRIMNAVFANNRRGVEAGVREELTRRVYRRCRAEA